MLPNRTLLNPPPVADLLAELAAFGERVSGLLNDPTVDWRRRPTDAEWSLTEVACHLRDVEREVHQLRFDAILTGEGAFLAGVDADEWAGPRDYRGQNGRVAAAEFADARAETLAWLNPLPADVWDRQGQHTFFGPTSLHELVYLAVQHDRVHGDQIAGLLGRNQ